LACRREKASSKDFRKKLRRLENKSSELRQAQTELAKNVCKFQSAGGT
jgi:uncharacterized membrane protein (DUF106 family)